MILTPEPHAVGDLDAYIDGCIKALRRLLDAREYVEQVRSEDPDLEEHVVQLRETRDELLEQVALVDLEIELLERVVAVGD